MIKTRIEKHYSLISSARRSKYLINIQTQSVTLPRHEGILRNGKKWIGVKAEVFDWRKLRKPLSSKTPHGNASQDIERNIRWRELKQFIFEFMQAQALLWLTSLFYVSKSITQYSTRLTRFEANTHLRCFDTIWWSCWSLHWVFYD